MDSERTPDPPYEPHPDPRIETNRVMWNATAEVHARAGLDELLERFRSDPAFGVLDPTETAVLEGLGVAGKRVAQLSCNNARELLSVARMGAAEALGVDISEAFLAQAERLLAAARAAGPMPPVRFVRSDVLALPRDLDGRFDLVTVTVGALGWMPDLAAWWRVVARLLAPGGAAFLYEMHPVLDMFDPDSGLVAKRSYFRTEPHIEEAAPDYLDPETIVEAPSYWFHHTLGDVLGGALAAGLAVERFAEHDHDVSAAYRAFQDLEAKPPLSYTLVVRKAE